MDRKKRILEATLEAFNHKGMKFTMDDVAKEAGMSKKTVYNVFHDKTELILAMVDDIFDHIKDKEAEIFLRTDLPIEDRVRQILGAMPSGYEHVDLAQLFLLKDKYPDIYQRVELRLETGWEGILGLIEEGISLGIVRPVSLPLVKIMLEASLEQFFQRDILVRNKITYQDALAQVVSIITDGIIAR